MDYQYAFTILQKTKKDKNETVSKYADRFLIGYRNLAKAAGAGANLVTNKTGRALFIQNLQDTNYQTIATACGEQNTEALIKYVKEQEMMLSQKAVEEKMGENTCGFCNVTNHKERDCRKKEMAQMLVTLSPRRVNTTTPPRRENANCYKCGKPGHLARDCRSSPRNSGQNRGESQNRNPSYGRNDNNRYNERYRSPGNERERINNTYDQNRYTNSPRTTRYNNAEQNSSNERPNNMRRNEPDRNRTNQNFERFQRPDNRANSNDPRRQENRRINTVQPEETADQTARVDLNANW